MRVDPVSKAANGRPQADDVRTTAKFGAMNPWIALARTLAVALRPVLGSGPQLPTTAIGLQLC